MGLNSGTAQDRAFWRAAMLVASVSGGTQTSAAQAPPSSSQSTPSAVAKSPVAKASETGVWHHFGEGPSAPAAEPRQSGGWRHFREGGCAAILS